MIALPNLVWRPSPNFDSRKAPIDLIVAHDCQGGYQSAIGTFLNPATQVSAHIVLREDGLEATQMVSFDKNAWHCRSFNSRSIGLEMAGFAEKGFSDAEWGAEAAMIAFLLHAYRIPVQWAKGGVGPGFCRHYDLGKAGGGHSDPTTDDKVWTAFVARVQAAYAAGGFPSSWGRGLPGAAAPMAQQPVQHAPGPVRDTAWCQRVLNHLGAKPPLQVDGAHGPLTAAALSVFQSKRGISATGLLDPVTIAALAAA